MFNDFRYNLLVHLIKIQQCFGYKYNKDKLRELNNEL